MEEFNGTEGVGGAGQGMLQEGDKTRSERDFWVFIFAVWAEGGERMYRRRSKFRLVIRAKLNRGRGDFHIWTSAKLFSNKLKTKNKKNQTCRGFFSRPQIQWGKVETKQWMRKNPKRIRYMNRLKRIKWKWYVKSKFPICGFLRRLVFEAMIELQTGRWEVAEWRRKADDPILSLKNNVGSAASVERPSFRLVLKASRYILRRKFCILSIRETRKLVIYFYLAAQYSPDWSRLMLRIIGWGDFCYNLWLDATGIKGC